MTSYSQRHPRVSRYPSRATVGSTHLTVKDSEIPCSVKSSSLGTLLTLSISIPHLNAHKPKGKNRFYNLQRSVINQNIQPSFPPNKLSPHPPHFSQITQLHWKRSNNPLPFNSGLKSYIWSIASFAFTRLRALR